MKIHLWDKKRKLETPDQILSRNRTEGMPDTNRDQHRGIKIVSQASTFKTAITFIPRLI